MSNLFGPRIFKEALGDPNRELAVMEEMNALKTNGTWLSRDKKTVG